LTRSSKKIMGELFSRIQVVLDKYAKDKRLYPDPGHQLAAKLR